MCFHATEAEDWLSPKFWKKLNSSIIFWASFIKSWQIIIYIRVKLVIKFHKVRCISFKVTFTAKCLFYKYRYFSKIVKSCSRHPKTCKTLKTESLNFLQKKYFHLIYTEETKSKVAGHLSKMCPNKSYEHRLLLLVSCI